MCLIFHRKPEGGKIDWSLLKRGFETNPHGVGVLYWQFGKWNVEKGVGWTWEHTRGVLGDLERQAEQWAVHFRWATKGVRDDRNCHPFHMGRGCYLMHNGTSNVAIQFRERSDSWHLARAVRKSERDVKWVIDQAVGSRLLIATAKGDVGRIGEWHERSAGWFSNDRCFKSCKQAPKAPTWFESRSALRSVWYDELEAV